MSEEVGTGKLTVGILQNMDIAQNLTGFLTFSVDQTRMNETLKSVETLTNRTLASAQALASLGLKDGYSILKQAFTIFPQDFGVLVRQQRDQLLQSAAGMKMTSSMMSQYGKLYAQNQLTDLYNTLIFDMPEKYVKEKVSRFYNNMFRQAIFPPSLATTLYVKKKIDEKKWREILAQNGIPDKDMDLIYDEADKDIEITNLSRMFQVIDVPDALVEKALDESGVTDKAQRTVWKSYLAGIRLRDEYSQYVQYLKRAYQNGLLTDAQLTTELTAFKPSKPEIDMIVATSKSEFLRTLTNSETETLLWLYRKGGFKLEEEETEEDVLYNRLSNLGISTALVNAMVRLEASKKKGMDWEKQ